MLILDLKVVFLYKHSQKTNDGDYRGSGRLSTVTAVKPARAKISPYQARRTKFIVRSFWFSLVANDCRRKQLGLEATA